MDAVDSTDITNREKDKHLAWFYWVFMPLFLWIGYAGSRGDDHAGILMIISAMLIFPVTLSYWILMPLCFRKSSASDSFGHFVAFGMAFSTGLWIDPQPNGMEGMALPFMPLLVAIIVFIGAVVVAAARSSFPAKEHMAGESPKIWVIVFIFPILMAGGLFYASGASFEDRGFLTRKLPEDQCYSNVMEIADSLPPILTPDVIKKTQPGWCEYLRYRVSSKRFKCPLDKKGPCSYALNKNLLGVRSWKNCGESDVVLLFESKPGWNQIGGPELLESHGHFGKKGIYVYLNGNGIEYVEEADIPKLKWFPGGMNPLEDADCQVNLQDISASFLEGLNPDGIKSTESGWCDYVKDKLCYGKLKCQLDEKGPCSYAVNEDIIGLDNWGVMRSHGVVALFESKPGWNQIGGPELLESHGHFGKKGVYVYLIDSGIEYVEEADIPKLKWVPEADCESNLQRLADYLPEDLWANIIKETEPGWCDYLEKEMYSYRELKCQLDKKGPCSYAINKNLVDMPSWSLRGKKDPDVVLLFESKPGWNQIGGPELLESHGHFRKKGVYVYLIGRGVVYVEEADIPKLKWVPDAMN